MASNLGLKKLAVNAAATLGRQVGSGLIQLVAITIVARVYGAEGNGVYTLSLLLPTMLATILNLGIGPANVYYLGSKQVGLRSAWKTTFQLSVAIGLLGWLIGAGAIYWYSDKWFPGVPESMLWLSLSFFPLIFLYSAIGNLFQGLQEFKKYNSVLIVQPIVNLVLVLIVVYILKLEMLHVLVCYLISVVINFLLALRLLYQLLPEKTGPKLNKYHKHLLSYGYKAHLSNILAFINNRADIFLLGYFIGPAAVGVYSVVVSLTEKLWLFSGAISTVLLPRLAELSSAENIRNQLTPLIARWVFWITFIGALVLAAISYFLLGTLFGEEFVVGTLVILWLVPGITLGACSMILANDMAARGRPELNLATSWIAVTINIIGNIVLIPEYGIEGAAMATSFAYTINMIMRLAMHQYFTGVVFYKNLLILPSDIQFIKQLLTAKKI